MHKYQDFLNQIDSIEKNKEITDSAKKNLLKIFNKTKENVEGITETDFMSFIEIALRDPVLRKLDLQVKEKGKEKKYIVKCVDKNAKNINIQFDVPVYQTVSVPISQRIKDLNLSLTNSVYGGLKGEDLQDYVDRKLERYYQLVCDKRLQDDDRNKLQSWGRYYEQLQQEQEENV